MKKNKKGFTLVELLAVIIILIVIILIAYNIIKKNVDDTLDNTVRANAGVYIKGVNSFVSENAITNAEYNNGKFTVAQLDTAGIKISGTKPDSGYVIVRSAEVVYSCIVYDENTIRYESGELKGLSTEPCTDLEVDGDFSYTGSEATFTATLKGTYKIELWGAQGGSTPDAPGGNGAYTSGEISLNKGDKLYIYVGGKGAQKTSSDATGAITGGYNGGGNGYLNRTTCSQANGAGGGATDVRLVNGAWNNTESLNSRIMVAGGGGGSFQEFCSGTDNGIITGGSGGSLEGLAGTYVGSYAGFSSINPTGGTQTTGGQSINGWDATTYSTSYLGAFGYGATGTQSYGGGGGGYWGGASGTWQPGAGGSSYVSGYTGCVAITSASNRTPKSGCTNGTTDNSCSIHYSNKKFNDPVIIDGDSEMPTFDGTLTMMGNSDDGYAKITFLK